MNTVSFEGFNTQYLTFKVANGSTLKAGDFVSISADGTVTTHVAAKDIVGKCIFIRGEFATVQVSGYMTAPKGSSVSIAHGYVPLEIDANGNAKTSSSATRCVLVVDFPSTTSVGFIL